MNRTAKSIFAMLIAVAMIFTALPMGALAQEADDAEALGAYEVATPATTNEPVAESEPTPDELAPVAPVAVPVAPALQGITPTATVDIQLTATSGVTITASTEDTTWIGTSGSGTATWVKNDKKLTLDNFNFESTPEVVAEAFQITGITDEVTLELKNTNTLKSNKLNTSGLRVESPLKITGSGSLTATGNGAGGSGGNGITFAKPLEISGGTVTAIGGATGHGIYSSGSSLLTISGGTVTATGNGSGAGIANSGNIEISNNSIVIAESAGSGTGILTNSTGTITISGGTVTATGKGTSAGIYSGGNLTISGGTVEATGGPSTNSGIGSGNNIVVTYTGKTGASVLAKGVTAFNKAPTQTEVKSHKVGSGGTQADGAYTYDSSHTEVTLYSDAAGGGTIDYILYFKADGKLYKGSNGPVYTEQSDKWDANGNTLTLKGFDFETTAPVALTITKNATIVLQDGTTNKLTGGDNTLGGHSNGISADNLNVTITGNTGKLIVTTGNSNSKSSYGISTNLTVEGGEVTAYGGDAASQSNGVMSVTLAVTGGKLNAVAGTAGAANGSTGLAAMNTSVSGQGKLTAKGNNFAISSFYEPTAASAKGTTDGSTTNLQDATWDSNTYKIGGTTAKYVELGVAGGGSTTTITPGTSSGSSDSSKQETPAPVIAPLDNKSSGTLSTAINAATSSSGNGLGVKLKNVSNFTKENAAAILNQAKAIGKKATVSSDIISEDGRFVEVRVTLDPALITKTVRLDGYIRESQTFMAESKFKKYFSNKFMVVSLGQDGKFGQAAKIAAKIDSGKFDSTNNLYFYSYDKTENKYTRITEPKYRIDKNGYLHFYTELGGDIVISENPLEKRF